MACRVPGYHGDKCVGSRRTLPYGLGLNLRDTQIKLRCTLVWCAV